MKVAIIDSHGAGIGQAVIKKLRKEIEDIYLIALGTNTVATSNMIKAGADIGITGKQAIYSFCIKHKVDSIIVPTGILSSEIPNSEISSKLPNAIFQMDCTKYLIPLQKSKIYVPGTKNLQIKEMIEDIIVDLLS